MNRTPPRSTRAPMNFSHANGMKKKRQNGLTERNSNVQNILNKRRVRELSGARVKILEDIKKMLRPLRMSDEETTFEAFRILDDIFEKEPKYVEDPHIYEVSEHRTAVLFNSEGNVVTRVANKLREYHEKLYKKILQKYLATKTMKNTNNSSRLRKTRKGGR